MKNKLIILVILIVLLGVVGYVFRNNSFKSEESKVAKIVSPTPSPFTNWSTFKNGYEVKIPENWINSSDLNGHAVIDPGKHGVTVGSLIKIVISVNSDTDKPLTTQEEFDTWYERSNKEVTKDIIQKLDNTTVDGEKAVELVDTSVSEKTKGSWSLVTWTRKDGVNYYINSVGNKKITPTDFKVYDYLIKSFKFSSEE